MAEVPPIEFSRLAMSKKHRFATEEVETFSTVDLIAELKRRYQILSRPEGSCVIIGPPSAGSSTQAAFLRKDWGFCSISREDFLPANTDLTRGLARLSEELASFRCRRGFAVAHFPETATEAAAFDEMLNTKHPDWKDYKVVLLSLPSENDDKRTESSACLLGRAKGHLVHQASGRIYNSSVPELSPQTANTDDVTGESLTSPKWELSDFTDRLNKWWSINEPSVRKYYRSRISNVDAEQGIHSVSHDISKVFLAEEKEANSNTKNDTSSV